MRHLHKVSFPVGHGVAVVLVVLLLMWTTSSSQAAIISVDGDVATGITGLEVNGTVYDVLFKHGSFNGIFGPDPGLAPFVSDTLGAMAAEMAIRTELNNLGSIPSFVGPDSTSGSLHFLVPYVDGDTTVGSLVGTRQMTQMTQMTEWTVDGDTNFAKSQDTSQSLYAYATFQEQPPASVPEPSSIFVWLALLGVSGGTVLWRSRRSSNPSMASS